MKKSAIYLFILSTNAFSAESILISADRIPVVKEKSSSDVLIINKEELNWNKSSVGTLKSISGINIVTSGTSGSNSSIFLRGTDSSNTLVILDGIILNDPSNPNRAFDFSNLANLNIEKIEVLKGSQALAYGSNAIGGVILIKTKTIQKDGIESQVNVNLGSFDTTQLALSTAKKNKQSSYGFFVEHDSSDGFSSADDKTSPSVDFDGYFKRHYSGFYQLDLNEKTQLDFRTHLNIDQNDLDKGGGNGADDPNFKSINQELYSKVKVSHAINELINTSLQYSFTDSFRRSYDQNNANQSYDGSEYNRGQVHSLDFLFDQTINENLINESSLNITKEQNKNHSALNKSVYDQINYSLNKNIFLFGLRFDYNQYFKEHLTYKIGYSYLFDNFKLRASTSTGFRAPSLNQLFASAPVGNENLKPEKSKSYDLGFDYTFLNIESSTTFFYTFINDRFSFLPSTYKNINDGRAQTKGIDQTLNIKLNTNTSDQLNVSLLNAKSLSTGKRLERRPDLSINNNLFYKLNSHFLNFAQNFKSKRNDVDNNGNTTTTDAYLTFDFNYRYARSELTEWTLSLKNIFDTKYYEAWGYNTGGRTITLGYQEKF